MRPHLPRLGRSGGHLRRLPELPQTLRPRRIPLHGSRPDGGGPAGDRTGGGGRQAGGDGLPGRYDGLRRRRLQDAGRRPLRRTRPAAARRRDPQRKDLCQRQGGQARAHRRPRPLRRGHAARAHRPRGLGREACAHLRGDLARGPADERHRRREGEGDEHRDEIQTRRPAGRVARGDARRQPRGGLLRAARDPPHRVGLPLPQQRAGQPASRPAQLEGRRAEGECGIHAAGHPAAAHPRLPGAYAPPRRLDLGDERRGLHPRAEQLARQFAERLLPHRRVHAAQRREPQHVAFRVARGRHPQHDRHPPQAELLLRQRQCPLQRLRLPQREPDPAPHRRGADPDRHAHGQRPPQHRRRTQCRIRFPPLAPLVDEPLGRRELLFGRQRRPADRHAGLDPRAAPSAAQRRRGDPLQHQRLGSLPLPAGRTRADPPLLPLRPRAQPLAAARPRLPERPAGGSSIR